MADSFVTHPPPKGCLKAGLSPPTSGRWVTNVKPRTTAASDVADRFKDSPRDASSTPGLEGKAADKPGIGTKRLLPKRRSGNIREGRRTARSLRGPYGPVRSTKVGSLCFRQAQATADAVRGTAGSPLLTRGRAIMHRRDPLTIRLKDRVGGDVGPVRVKIDPGSKTTAIALVADADGNKPGKVLCLFEFAHRGPQISEALTARLAFRRRRRGANLRYRAPRFDHRTRAQGNIANAVTGAGAVELCVRGFKTGDMMRAEAPKGKQARIQVGPVTVWAGGSFGVGDADAINAKYCKLLHRADRYGCAWRPALPPPAEAGGLRRGRLG
jgi:RRXRR protein